MALFAYYLLVSLVLWVHLGLFFIFAITIIAWLAELDKGNLTKNRTGFPLLGRMLDCPGNDKQAIWFEGLDGLFDIKLAN